MDRTKNILDATKKLIVGKGLHVVTIADIAVEAKVGIGTIYKRFKDKEEIVVHTWIEQKKAEARFIFKDYAAHGSIKDRFDFLWGRIVEYFMADREAFFFSNHLASSPILTPEIYYEAMKDFHDLDSLYSEGLERKVFKPMSAQHLRAFNFCSIYSYLSWVFREEAVVSEEEVTMLLAMLWDAVVAQDFRAQVSVPG